MTRYFFIILVILAVAPFVPRYLEQWTASQSVSGGGSADARDNAEVDGFRTYEIPIARNGQYVTDARLNGRTITMLVDTGASQIALPEDVANKIGIFLQPSDYKVPVRTANGTVKAAPTTLRELRIGPIRLKNVETLVLQEGLLSVPLLGMSALGRLERFDISDDTLVLVQ